MERRVEIGLIRQDQQRGRREEEEGSRWKEGIGRGRIGEEEEGMRWRGGRGGDEERGRRKRTKVKIK